MTTNNDGGDTQGDVCRVRVERLAVGGEGVGFLSDGRVVFVAGGLPGDVVDVELTARKKRHARGVALRRVEDGEVREGGCAVGERCGGCVFQGVSYAAELGWKVEAAAGVVRRIGRGVEWPAAVVVGAKAVEGWRGRARLRVLPDGRTGYREWRGHGVVAVAACPVLDGRVEAVRVELRGLLRRVSAVVGEVHLEVGDDGRVGVLLLAKEGVSGVLRRVEAAVAAGVPEGVSGVVVEGPPGREVMWGEGETVRRRAGRSGEVEVREPVGAFSQANGEMNGVLRELVRGAVVEAAGGDGGRVLELFAGSGNFTGELLAEGLEVVAVEGAAGALEAYAGGAGEGVRAVVADLGEGLRGAAAGVGEGCGVVVVDPPRTGLPGAVAEELAGAGGARRLVYVSCDPPTMARDVGILAGGGWRVTRWTLVDAFPRTAHLEAVVVLDRNAR